MRSDHERAITRLDAPVPAAGPHDVRCSCWLAREMRVCLEYHLMGVPREPRVCLEYHPMDVPPVGQLHHRVTALPGYGPPPTLLAAGCALQWFPRGASPLLASARDAPPAGALYLQCPLVGGVHQPPDAHCLHSYHDILRTNTQHSTDTTMNMHNTYIRMYTYLTASIYHTRKHVCL